MGRRSWGRGLVTSLKEEPFIDSPKRILYMLTGLNSWPAPTEKRLMKVLQLVKG